ncbi:MAG: roadblock/LC7 domain-containing protein [Candidatus Baldrarchaeia archaeon]
MTFENIEGRSEQKESSMTKEGEPVIPAAFKSTLEKLSSFKGVEGVLAVDDEGFPLQSTLKIEKAEALSAFIKSFATQIEKLSNELDLGDVKFATIDAEINGQNKEILLALEEDMYLCVLRSKAEEG